MKDYARRLLARMPDPVKAAAYGLRYIVLSPPSDPRDLEKQKIVLSYLRKYQIKCFVETGTCFGQMVRGVRDDVNKVYSIEIDRVLYAVARMRFRRDSKVRIFHGDSGNLLRQLVPSLEETSLFWLDAHYSGGVTGKGSTDTPILSELEAIGQDTLRRHIILIDDTAYFGHGDYPTLEATIQGILRIDHNYLIDISDGVLRAVPGLPGPSSAH